MDEVPEDQRAPLMAAYSERFGKMPTASGVLRALPNPADHAIFVIKTWNNRIDGFQMSLNQNLVDTARPFTI